MSVALVNYNCMVFVPLGKIVVGKLSSYSWDGWNLWRQFISIIPLNAIAPLDSEQGPLRGCDPTAVYVAGHAESEDRLCSEQHTRSQSVFIPQHWLSWAWGDLLTFQLFHCFAVLQRLDWVLLSLVQWWWTCGTCATVNGMFASLKALKVRHHCSKGYKSLKQNQERHKALSKSYLRVTSPPRSKFRSRRLERSSKRKNFSKEYYLSRYKILPHPIPLPGNYLPSLWSNASD